jgi:hypothetical protein
VRHLPHVTNREHHALGLALRWSYSSTFGLMHRLLTEACANPGRTLHSAAS